MNYYPAPKTLEAFPDAKQVKPKTPVQGGGGLRKRWDDQEYRYEWDSRHGLVEKYDRRGNHLGEFDPKTGEQINPKIASRRILS
ncbi:MULTISPECIES: colicin E3/pyocin S6 family cytotoxin [unclassified Nostoc]|uniref:colicin E3/pyocin S6 family cytotoxin n=1 Tax=unclassified Nostoc TaxID=2593658 RepID=UPI002AD237AA|nr:MULTISPECIES: colicin E3/pyocin S6 family cytotoxin [unclassified Nostoc]MDZ8129576.1 colicin E3/pyocin S6 family cytotoxin [Nostoc sp. DedQUE07]MDZ8214073.1 colicin E3/pyocin S6 family cytotoxin [Nostoc sp. ChiSLP03a]